MNRLPLTRLAFARFPLAARVEGDGVRGDQAQERR